MNEYRLHTRLMGCSFELLIGHEEENKAAELLQLGVNEIKRIEDLLSEFRENTTTTLLNRMAGISPVKVEPEVYQLIERCQAISSLTKGAFDISVGPLKKIYRFKNTGFELPDKTTVAQALEHTGYRHIVLSAATREVFLSKPGMSVSFAAIGKGYAADCVKKLWLSHGVKSAVVSASGDLCTIGHKPDGSRWTIGIASPDDRDKTLLYIPVEHASVATSGDYEQYFMHQGRRYAHNINPVTGMPVTGIKSVSLLSPGAELSDALATAVTVMGVEAGIHFVDQLPDTHCLIIDEHNQVHHSRNIHILHEK
jgi:thiamine biosynthesis lipoprotein